MRNPHGEDLGDLVALLASLLAAGYVRLLAARASASSDTTATPGPRRTFAAAQTPLDVAARPSADCVVPTRERKTRRA